MWSLGLTFPWNTQAILLEWVLGQHHDSSLFPWLPQMQQKLRMQIFVYCFVQNFWQIIMHLSIPTIGRSWGVNSRSCHCYAWCGWWSVSLLVTFIWLWLHPILVMLVLCFAGTDRMVTLQRFCYGVSSAISWTSHVLETLWLQNGQESDMFSLFFFPESQSLAWGNCKVCI
jgi:hypothetical protein